jgi:hypothetical protein
LRASFALQEDFLRPVGRSFGANITLCNMAQSVVELFPKADILLPLAQG